MCAKWFVGIRNDRCMWRDGGAKRGSEEYVAKTKALTGDGAPNMHGNPLVSFTPPMRYNQMLSALLVIGIVPTICSRSNVGVSYIIRQRGSKQNVMETKGERTKSWTARCIPSSAPIRTHAPAHAPTRHVRPRKPHPRRRRLCALHGRADDRQREHMRLDFCTAAAAPADWPHAAASAQSRAYGAGCCCCWSWSYCCCCCWSRCW